MKKLFLSAALITLVTFTSCKKEAEVETETVTETVAEEVSVAETSNVDNAKSVIMWTGAKPTGKHMGTLMLKSGNLMFADDKVSGGEFVIDMNSLMVTDLSGEEKAKLEGHLKGAAEGEAQDHFFNVSTYPTASFKMTSITEKDGTYMVNGDLTIKDKTNPISFPAKITMENNMVTLQSDSFKINRTKWGVNYGSKSIFDDLKDNFINDDIEISVKLVATK